jgi:LysM repeat protein
LKNLILAKLVLALALCGGFAQAQSLKGSPTSIENQYRAAQSYGFTFVSTARAVKELSPGQLVRVSPDQHMELHDVSYPYAVRGTKLFLDRLSVQYHSVCGEKLTVTSLLRPRDRQPANSVAHSVHPTGMAVDLRIPSKQQCRTWLENTLLSLERDKVLDVTRERYPPHYHVAVFVRNYETRVAAMTGSDSVNTAHAVAGGQTEAAPKPTYVASSYRYVVRRGDTLSEIAARNRVRVAQLRAVNGLRGNLINIGQKLRIPTTGTVASSADANTVIAVNEITHRVHRGDTLWRIANRYGTSVKQLRRVNGKTSDFLQVGQVLKISKG